jgi:hypothetical protein
MRQTMAIMVLLAVVSLYLSMFLLYHVLYHVLCYRLLYCYKSTTRLARLERLLLSGVQISSS